MVLGRSDQGIGESWAHSRSSYHARASTGDDRSKVTFQDYVGRIVSVLKAKTTPVVLGSFECRFFCFRVQCLRSLRRSKDWFF